MFFQIEIIQSARREESQTSFNFDFERIHMPSLRPRYLSISQTLQTFTLLHLTYLLGFIVLYLQIIFKIGLKIPLFLVPFSGFSIYSLIRHILMVIGSYRLRSAFFTSIEMGNDDWIVQAKSKRRLAIRVALEEICNLVAYVIFTLHFNMVKIVLLSYSLIPLFISLALKFTVQGCPKEHTQRLVQFMYTFGTIFKLVVAMLAFMKIDGVLEASYNSVFIPFWIIFSLMIITSFITIVFFFSLVHSFFQNEVSWQAIS
jgi:hypothetical protein